MQFNLLDKLVTELARFPGIGKKSAIRIAFFLLQNSQSEIHKFTTILNECRNAIGTCPVCGSLSEKNSCPICNDTRRDKNSFCIVETVRDLITIERTRQHNGQYHVLGGALSPLDGIGPTNLSINELIERLVNYESDHKVVQEVIMATNPTLEGEATANYIADLIRDKFPKMIITRIAHGIQTGGEMEFADNSTLSRSFADRRPIS